MDDSDYWKSILAFRVPTVAHNSDSKVLADIRLSQARAVIRAVIEKSREGTGTDETREDHYGKRLFPIFLAKEFFNAYSDFKVNSLKFQKYTKAQASGFSTHIKTEYKRVGGFGQYLKPKTGDGSQTQMVVGIKKFHQSSQAYNHILEKIRHLFGPDSKSHQWESSLFGQKHVSD